MQALDNKCFLDLIIIQVIVSVILTFEPRHIVIMSKDVRTATTERVSRSARLTGSVAISDGQAD